MRISALKLVLVLSVGFAVGVFLLYSRSQQQLRDKQRSPEGAAKFLSLWNIKHLQTWNDTKLFPSQDTTNTNHVHSQSTSATKLSVSSVTTGFNPTTQDTTNHVRSQLTGPTKLSISSDTTRFNPLKGTAKLTASRNTAVSTPSTAISTLVTFFPQKTSFATMNTVDDMYKRLIFVTAFSHNHFAEARDMIASTQRCFPEKRIIVYDLGLAPIQKKEVKNYCNVELRTFPFNKYPPHVKNLFKYAWKPIIVKEVSLEYDVIMYGDASLRIQSCNMTSALAYLFKFPYLNAKPVDYRAIQYTHDGMIQYLRYPASRGAIAELITLQGGCWLMWVNEVTQKKLIDPWVDCALHQECIAPDGATLWPCYFTSIHDGHYVGCHRFDQSALNLIVAREFGLDGYWRAINEKISRQLWKVEKYPTKVYNISVCS